MLIPSRIAGSRARPSTRRTLVIWSIFIFSFVSVGAHAQNSDADELLVLNLVPKDEFIDPQERISGGAAVGIVYYEVGDQVQLDAAFVRIAEPVNDNFEMQIATIDGRFLATFEFDLVAQRSGWVRLNLKLGEPAFLGNYTLDEIALLITNANTGKAYPVRWGTRAEGEFVRVYINTEGARSYFASFDESQQRLTPRSCRAASKRSSFKFDRVCDVPVADVMQDGTIEIIRKRGAGFGTPIEVTVALPQDVAE